MTILEAIKEVLCSVDNGLSSKEIFNYIIKKNLYKFSAKNPSAVVNGMIRRHCFGLNFPTSHPIKYFKIVGYDNKAPLYSLLTSAIEKTKKRKDITEEKEKLPEEIVQSAYEEHIKNLKESLLDCILQHDPAFFEQLIVDLLIAMEYGYDKSSGVVVGGVHDGGIDGIIYEDKLGLDKIYLQAKRYKKGENIGRKDIQAFVGAMESVQKGVFITTSNFTKEAINYAQGQQQKSLMLINGEKLTDLMVQFEVGIQRITRPIYFYRLNKMYFGE